ncbi:uncharacterized protein LOC124722613 [Schistocerca piceifrons]|uniref:uncharacterized protein LOC124722613 n=1 Tax=Schistocerca piceifrons TaxID=274613 RepID=UPI001F5E9668|nr:uncharacterized protein LOC124722613 [Schistocerca piceifrons]
MCVTKFFLLKIICIATKEIFMVCKEGGLFFKCTLCPFQSSSKQGWIDHLQTAHHIQLNSEDLQFSDEDEFLQWKEDTERTTHSKFIKTHGSTSSTHYYGCHRSGNFISKGKGTRHLKLTGSNKMNGKYPAEMKVTVHEGGTYQVHFVSTHIGHKQDLTHLPPSQKDRETIATDIAMGLPYDKVLDNVRTSLQDSDLQRIHLTTKQDLYNIAASYNLSSKSVRHKNDAISVEAWVKEMNESENPSVLFYKPQDSTSEHQELRSEDFVLVIMNRAQREMLSKYGEDCICIDGTHGLNGYDFEVTTLLVLDELRQGFPCAFLISNRKDAEF